MKYLILFLLLVSGHSFAQNREISKLEYQIINNIYIDKLNQSIEVKYKGLLYYDRAAEVGISYFKTDYLDEFPGGKFEYEYPNGQGTMQLFTDSILTIYVYDFKAGKYAADIRGKVSNSFSELYAGRYKWNPTGIIESRQNIQCETYIVSSPKSGNPLWELWISKEDKIPFFFNVLYNSPGLVIEAYEIFNNYHFYLKNYTTESLTEAQLKTLFFPNSFAKKLPYTLPYKD